MCLCLLCRCARVLHCATAGSSICSTLVACANGGPAPLELVFPGGNIYVPCGGGVVNPSA